ncbi:MAG: hypothetical protein DRG33_05060 [Deltaproteobacteria bacterium]|nr:MAG: hypothetical protein DRG33_05060 [Deltaproteobacteria bacterium]
MARIWFRCAAVHDPVCPVLVRPALIGWDAKFRQIDLAIEAPLRGEELLRRMKGWITVDPEEVIRILREFGAELTVSKDGRLEVSLENTKDPSSLQRALQERFGREVDLEL